MEDGQWECQRILEVTASAYSKPFELTAASAYDEAISGYFRRRYASANSTNDLVSRPI